MAGSYDGVKPIGDYVTPSGDAAKVQAMIDLIPDPDSLSSNGAKSGGGYLDEISPAAAIQLRVDLLALKAAVT